MNSVAIRNSISRQEVEEQYKRYGNKESYVAK